MRSVLCLVVFLLLLSGCAPQMSASPPAETGAAPVTAPPDITPTLTARNLLLVDDFRELSFALWTVWGRPAPMVQGGGNDTYLVLSGIDPRYESGMTSIALIPFLSGATIRLDAFVPSEWQSRDAWLALDWDDRPGVEAARIQEGAVIRLLLVPGSVTLYTRETDLECSAPVDTSRPHTYTLKLQDVFGVDLWIDQAAQPACRHDYTDHIYEIARTGPITLTGAGWLTHIEAGR